MNLLYFFQRKSKIDDVFIAAGKVAIIVAILFGFNALTSFNVANGHLEETIRSRKEEEDERAFEKRLEEGREERKRRSTVWLSEWVYVRIYGRDNRIDTFELAH